MTDTPAPMMIKVDDLVRIFQISDPSLFIKVGQDDMDAHIANSTHILAELNSEVLEDLEKTAVTENGIYHCPAGKGGIISFRLFSRESPDGTSSDFVTMTIVQVDDQGEDCDASERYKPEPIFTFTGIIIHDSVIVVREAIARLADDEPDYHTVRPLSQDDFTAMIIYADECFAMMLRNEKIDLKKIEHFLSDKEIAKASQRFNLLCDRTKLDINRTMDHLPPSSDCFAIAQSEFTNIFQLENAHIYDALPPEDFADIKQLIADILRTVESQYAIHFNEDVMFTDEPIYIQTENGDSLWSISYTVDDAFGIGRDYHLLIVAGPDEPAKNNGQHMTVRPLALLVGNMDYARGEYEFLEAICRAKKTDGDKPFDFFFPVRGENGFLAAICYAEEAMENLILQKKLDAAELSKWIRGHHQVIIDERYSHIAQRSAQQLTDELSNPDSTQTDSKASHVMNQFQIPDGYKLN